MKFPNLWYVNYFVLFVPYSGDQYTAKCDIFSLAITLWEMLARQLPTIEPNTRLNSYAILFKMVEGVHMLLVSLVCEQISLARMIDSLGY